MRFSTKNKIAIILLVILILPILTLSMVLPRIRFVTELTGGGDFKTELYDLYFADYSDDPDQEGVKRFTLKLLLDMRNPYDDKKIIIPRLSLDLKYLGQEVGELWTKDELILEPFKDNESNSAGLLPIYLTLFTGGNESALAAMISEVLKGNLGVIDINLDVYLGDLPIKIDILIGELLGALAGDEGGFDVNSIMGMLGGEGGLLGGGDEMAIPENYLFLYNTTVEASGKIFNDIRALLNSVNRSIFTNQDDRLLFGAKDKFEKIYWVNGTNSNEANGDGIYTWEYWNGNNWVSLNVNDGTLNFTKTGDITFTQPSNWEKMKATRFWDRDYYYVQCKVNQLDSGVDMDKGVNNTYISMNVKESKINDYKTPSDSSLFNINSIQQKEKATDYNIAQEDEVQYPELKEFDKPIEKGLLQTDMEIDKYLEVNGIKLIGDEGDDLVYTYIIPALQRGAENLNFRENIYLINQYPILDLDVSTDIEIEPLIDGLLKYLAAHNEDLMNFLSKCEIDFGAIFSYIGENFQGWIAPNGTDIVTGENIYSPISETERYNNTIVFSFVLFLIMIAILGVVAPYFGQKRVDQSFIFEDIKNLDTYIDKVKKEMEEGITEEEIDLLKSATFKKKDMFKNLDKKEGEANK